MLKTPTVQCLFLCLFVAVLASGTARADDVVAAAYETDVPYPQFMHLWSERWSLKTREGEPAAYAAKDMPLGAYVQVYFQNRGPAPVAISDVKLEGVPLSEALPFSRRPAGGMYPASIHFSKLPERDMAALIAAGEPVWWKADPPLLEPGAFGQVTVRLRRQTKAAAVTVQIVATNASWQARVQTNSRHRFLGLCISPALDTVYAYLSAPAPQHAAPVKLFLDQEEVTARTTFASDPVVDVVPLVLRLPHPLTRSSFHCFRALYDDGTTAVAGILAWSDEFTYGMWGYINQGQTAQERVDFFLGDLARHNINAVMESYGAEVGEFLSGPSGLEHSRATGIRAMRNHPGNVLQPLYYFLKDEPDANDFAATELEPNQRLGVLGQDVVRRSYEFRQQDPATPQLLNVDNTYKPENWYMYARIADVCCADPYFQEQQRIVWNERPVWAASFLKPDYILGAATICRSACAPRPLHIILNAVRHDDPAGRFRFATPEEKTVELFYALGAGATGFSYWWYTPYGQFHGCGARDKEAVALWRQIGRLGALVRTAGPVLIRSCPAQVPLKAPSRLWTRTLLAGTDTLALLAVNDNLASDRLGTVVVPLPKTSVRLTLPAWLAPMDVFEITPEGTVNVQWKIEQGLLVLELGETRVARLILASAQPGLRQELQALYQRRFAANATRLKEGSPEK